MKLLFNEHAHSYLYIQLCPPAPETAHGYGLSSTLVSKEQGVVNKSFKLKTSPKQQQQTEFCVNYGFSSLVYATTAAQWSVKCVAAAQCYGEVHTLIGSAVRPLERKLTAGFNSYR